ncbi:MAG TPA: hypothetical protein VGI93_15670 [Steroidobacteraceae bacterium]|jgi:hypothetical protein
MLIAMLDEKQHALAENNFAPADERNPSPRHHIQPLIGAPMPIAGAAFSAARIYHHLRSLRATITEHHSKALAESQLFGFQVTSLDIAAETMLSAVP